MIFIIELENKITGKVTTNEMNVITDNPEKFKKDYCRRMHSAYLRAITAEVVSRMYIK
jgi:hypothetical protein